MDIKLVRVSNEVSPRSGNQVANQFNIQTEEGNYFQSYNTIIAFQDREGNLYLESGEHCNYSWNCTRTTQKYLYQWLGKNRAEVLAGIKDGTITLTDLNS